MKVDERGMSVLKSAMPDLVAMNISGSTCLNLMFNNKKEKNNG